MNKKKAVLVALLIGIIIATASAVFAAITLYYNMPMNATVVPSGASLAIYINGTAWTNSTEVGWGQVQSGNTYAKALDIYNDGSQSLQILLITAGIPAGWLLTYSRNGTLIDPSTWLNGTMQLTIATSTPASYYWSASIVGV